MQSPMSQAAQSTSLQTTEFLVTRLSVSPMYATREVYHHAKSGQDPDSVARREEVLYIHLKGGG